MEAILNDFYGLTLATTKEYGFGGDALLLAEFACPKTKDVVLDLCTGCGIVPVMMMSKGFRGEITAVDIQEGAISLCEKTKELNGLDNFHPVLSDLKALDFEAESYSLITVNPPYFAAGTGKENGCESRDMARRETGCTLSDVVGVSARLLRFGGRLCMCHRPERLCDVVCEMRKNGIEPKRISFVNNDTAKEPWLILVEGKKGGHAGVKLSYVRSGR